MGVVCHQSVSKRSETERYVISNCPIMKRNEVSGVQKGKEKRNDALSFLFLCRTNATSSKTFKKNFKLAKRSE